MRGPEALGFPRGPSETNAFGRSCGPLWSQFPVPCCVASNLPEKKVANRAIVETSKAGSLSAQGGGQRLEEGSHTITLFRNCLTSSRDGILSSGSPQGLLQVPETCPWIFHKLAAAIFTSPGFGVSFDAGGLAPGSGVRVRRACSGHDSMTTF